MCAFYLISKTTKKKFEINVEVFPVPWQLCWISNSNDVDSSIHFVMFVTVLVTTDVTNLVNRYYQTFKDELTAIYLKWFKAM